MSVLVDNFQGDPDKFYEIFQEELNSKELPQDAQLKYQWGQETTTLKLLTTKAKQAKALAIHHVFGTHMVLAYQYGACFFLSARASFEKSITGKEGYLYEVHKGCVTTSIERAFESAVERYLKESGAPAEEPPSPEEVFSGQ